MEFFSSDCYISSTPIHSSISYCTLQYAGTGSPLHLLWIVQQSQSTECFYSGKPLHLADGVLQIAIQLWRRCSSPGCEWIATFPMLLLLLHATRHPRQSGGLSSRRKLEHFLHDDAFGMTFVERTWSFFVVLVEFILQLIKSFQTKSTETMKETTKRHEFLDLKR